MDDFKLTYATMFAPPPALHRRFEQALDALRGRLGALQPLWIDGRDLATARSAGQASPIDRRVILGHFALAGAEEVDRAMQAARRAWPSWARLPWTDRVLLLRRAAQALESRVVEIGAALALEVGKNRMEALGEAQETAEFFHVFAAQLEQHAGFDRPLPDDPIAGFRSHNRSVMKPYGVWVVIAPFNFPLALAGGPAAAALAAGNTVVVKGASATPWAARLLAEALREAGFPPGVFNVVHGSGAEVGEALVRHPLAAGFTFTGSHEVGLHIVAVQSQLRRLVPVIAELGGKNAVVVTRHADLERAALGIVRSAFGLQGQKCSALSRIYVEASVADALIEALVARIATIAVGDPTEERHWMGPVIDEAAGRRFATACAELAQAGARLIAGGRLLEDGPLAHGSYCAPTVYEAPVGHPAWERELFAPLALLRRVRDLDEGLAAANASAYGLTAGFYGSEEEARRFFDRVEAGVCYANRPQGATTGAWPGYQPFGGWKASGSTGKGLASFHYLPQYLREQSQTLVE